MSERGPIEHDIKCMPSFYKDIGIGAKGFEIRENDRDYRVGDTLLIREWHFGEYTGAQMRRRIIYLTDFNQAVGYVVMGLQPSLSSDIPLCADHAQNWFCARHLLHGGLNCKCVVCAFFPIPQKMNIEFYDDFSKRAQAALLESFRNSQRPSYFSAIMRKIGRLPKPDKK